MLTMSIRKGYREHLLMRMEDNYDSDLEEFLDVIENAYRYGHYWIFDLPDDLVLKARKKFIPDFMRYWQNKYPNKNALKKTSYRIMDEMKEYIELSLM